MQVVQISSEPRSTSGKKEAKVLRKAGRVLAVLYSSKGVESFSTTAKAVKSLVYTPDFKLAEIDLEGTKRRAILKDISFHPVTEEILHMDFLELIDGVDVIANIPVKFKGVSPGVKAGGKLVVGLRTVKIKTKPENLVDELFVDISSLELAQAARVRDIEVPAGVEIKVDGATPVAVIDVPRALKSAATAAKKEAGGKKK
jgi:large subunit ribosomal protein L25